MRVLAATGIFAAIAYVFTPLTASGSLGQPTGFEANLRYVAPALIIGLTITPLIPALRRKPWPWALIGVFALFILQGTLRVSIDGGLGVDAAPSWNYGHLDESLELALLVVGVPALIVAGARKGVRRIALAAFGIAAAALAIVLGNTQREEYLDERYEASVAPILEAGFRSTPEWTPLQVFGKRTRDARIGVVGRASAFGQYFFYGDDLSNHVQYLGNELRRGTFRQIDECRDFVQGRQRGRLRLHRRHAPHQARDEHPARALLDQRRPELQAQRQVGSARGRLAHRRPARPSDLRACREALPGGQGGPGGAAPRRGQGPDRVAAARRAGRGARSAQDQREENQ